MFGLIVGNILLGLASVLDIILSVYMVIVLARAIISWVAVEPGNPIVRFLVAATEPLLVRLRRRFPALRDMGGLDLTPLVVMAGIAFMKYAVVDTASQIAARLLGR